MYETFLRDYLFYNGINLLNFGPIATDKGTGNFCQHLRNSFFALPSDSALSICPSIEK
jgi:hypothetical protein